MKKIMFNDTYGLTQSVLDKIKNVTRRVIEFDLMNLYTKEPISVTEVFFKDDCWCIRLEGNRRPHPMPKAFLPKYKTDEVIAIAQPYRDILDYLPEGYRRKSDGWISDLISTSAGLNNKMFVRADLMPHHIKITGVKIERLQDISDEDCMKEGIEEYPFGWVYFDSKIKRCGGMQSFSSPREAFSALINKVSGKGTWEQNSFVWVYEFELVD